MADTRYPKYFFSYVVTIDGKPVFKNAQVQPTAGSIDTILDIEFIERTIELDRNYERGSVKILQYQKF